jgi:hypothetical protein
MPQMKSQATAEKDKAERSATYNLKDAGRPLNEAEEEAEEKAVKFNRMVYRRIPPVPGTLAFMLRNLKGGNESVIEFLKWARDGQNGTKAKFIDTFVIMWNNMDEFSRKRIDIFDVLCAKFAVPRRKFWGILQEGMYDHNEQLTQIALSGYKPEFIQKLMKMAEDRRNHNDRKILAESLKLTGQTPAVNVQDNSTNVTLNQQTNNFPSFASSIRRSEKTIKHEDTAIIPKELTEGETDFIEAELVASLDNDDEMLLKVAKEL